MFKDNDEHFACIKGKSYDQYVIAYARKCALQILSNLRQLSEKQEMERYDNE